jgi:hypothetical protein
VQVVVNEDDDEALKTMIKASRGDPPRIGYGGGGANIWSGTTLPMEAMVTVDCSHDPSNNTSLVTSSALMVAELHQV